MATTDQRIAKLLLPWYFLKNFLLLTFLSLLTMVSVSAQMKAGQGMIGIDGYLFTLKNEQGETYAYQIKGHYGMMFRRNTLVGIYLYKDISETEDFLIRKKESNIGAGTYLLKYIGTGSKDFGFFIRVSLNFRNRDQEYMDKLRPRFLQNLDVQFTELNFCPGIYLFLNARNVLEVRYLNSYISRSNLLGRSEFGLDYGLSTLQLGWKYLFDFSFRIK